MVFDPELLVVGVPRRQNAGPRRRWFRAGREDAPDQAESRYDEDADQYKGHLTRLYDRCGAPTLETSRLPPVASVPK